MYRWVNNENLLYWMIVACAMSIPMNKQKITKIVRMTTVRKYINQSGHFVDMSKFDWQLRENIFLVKYLTW